MSTDLKIQLTPIQIHTPHPIICRPLAESKLDRRLCGGEAAIATEKTPDRNNNSNNNSEADSELCRTPKSEKHRIPPIESPPPAPRKIRPTTCKRKLMPELEFVETVNGDKVRELFRSGFEFVAKRRKSERT